GPGGGARWRHARQHRRAGGARRRLHGGPARRHAGGEVSPATGARRRAREVAFRVAYQADIAGDAYAQAWTLRRESEDRLSADQLELIDDVVALLESGAARVDEELQGALEERWTVARL